MKNGADSTRCFLIKESSWKHNNGIYPGDYMALARLKELGWSSPHAVSIDYDGVTMATRLGETVLLVEAVGRTCTRLRRYFPRDSHRVSMGACVVAIDRDVK
jgi:hypothetical protein